MKPEFEIEKIRAFVAKGYTSVAARYVKSMLQHYDQLAEIKESESAKQRALLVAFAEWHSSTYYEEITMEEDVDEFLNTLKHSTK
jgi:hypothetical protein